MYGLKQAAVLAYENLIKNLAPISYEQIPHTDSSWRHKTVGNMKLFQYHDEYF